MQQRDAHIGPCRQGKRPTALSARRDQIGDPRVGVGRRGGEAHTLGGRSIPGDSRPSSELVG
jgi:hypothetical protein